MLLLLLNYVLLRALWNKDVYLISTLVNKSLSYYCIIITSIVEPLQINLHDCNVHNLIHDNWR